VSAHVADSGGERRVVWERDAPDRADRQLRDVLRIARTARRIELGIRRTPLTLGVCDQQRAPRGIERRGGRVPAGRDRADDASIVSGDVHHHNGVGRRTGDVQTPAVGPQEQRRRRRAIEFGLVQTDVDVGAAFRRFQIDDAERIVAYCGSGINACQAIFALRRAGYDNVLLYPGSWFSRNFRANV